jgi:lysocardiolipin and lysophospholipid acyltransferase
LGHSFPRKRHHTDTAQIYTDWVYLWWVAYTNKMHGHLYIILKESIKYIPVLGTGMMFYGFIFLSRKWAKDKVRFQYRLRKLSSSHQGPLSGSSFLDPMWLLIFPEGTNLSDNGRAGSKKWADKNGIEDLRHAMLPRSTGLLFCLQELEKTVDYMYDCTVAYEGVP